MKILVVEDSRLVRDRIRGIVEAIPKAVVVAETGNEVDARGLLEKYDPDVAVIDIRLTSGNGLSFLEHVKAIRPAVITIVLTNYGQPEYRDKCLQLGADHFLDKTLDIEAFDHLLADLSRLVPFGADN